MKTRLVQIGNSRGVRLPKTLLAEAQLPEEVELEAVKGRITIRPARAPRSGWEEEAALMHERGEDRLLDSPMATRFDENEWEWQ
jgi:antitoxin MazE